MQPPEWLTVIKERIDGKEYVVDVQVDEEKLLESLTLKLRMSGQGREAFISFSPNDVLMKWEDIAPWRGRTTSP